MQLELPRSWRLWVYHHPLLIVAGIAAVLFLLSRLPKEAH